MRFACPPYGEFINNANAQSAASAAQRNKDLVDKRAGVLIDKKNAKFSLDELIAAINDDKGNGNGQIKQLLGNPVKAERLMHRAPTTLERKIIEAHPDRPLAKLFRYAIVTYESKDKRGLALGHVRKQK